MLTKKEFTKVKENKRLSMAAAILKGVSARMDDGYDWYWVPNEYSKWFVSADDILSFIAEEFKSRGFAVTCRSRIVNDSSDYKLTWS